jgi:abortive infection bacteriophage resistance protein
MEDYNKAPFTYEQHIALLISRGLFISNPEEAMKFLKQVNYYRFTAYCIPFQNPHDVFIKGATFESIVVLYQLDEALRNAVFTMLTPIEIFLRTRMAYELSHKWGAFAHYDESMFQNKTEHTQWLADLEKAITDSKEPFLEHYKNKYNGFPRLLLWMACEVMSIGNLSTLYSILTREARLLICNTIGVNHDVFRTWLHTMTFLRNICAHHGRLWSRNFSIRPMIPDKIPEWQTINFNNKKLFASVAMME